MTEEQTLFVKDPDETLDYFTDWSPWLARYAPGDTVAECTVTTPSAPDALLTLAEPRTIDGNVVTMRLAGGTLGREYQVRLDMTTSGGESVTRRSTFQIRRSSSSGPAPGSRVTLTQQEQGKGNTMNRTTRLLAAAAASAGLAAAVIVGAPSAAAYPGPDGYDSGYCYAAPGMKMGVSNYRSGHRSNRRRRRQRRIFQRDPRSRLMVVAVAFGHVHDLAGACGEVPGESDGGPTHGPQTEERQDLFAAARRVDVVPDWWDGTAGKPDDRGGERSGGWWGCESVAVAFALAVAALVALWL